MSNRNGRLNRINQHPRSYLFTVRVWPERLAQDEKEWRGQVRFVLSGETCYFRDWTTLVNFLEYSLSELVT